MKGELDLSTLLKEMEPRLHAGEYVFCTIQEVSEQIAERAILIFREEEGTTVILERKDADEFNLPSAFVTAWITLTVHSSLQAVGLTAAFSKALTAAGISCNVVAAYYHDHIFVDIRDGKRAVDVLNAIRNSDAQ